MTGLMFVAILLFILYSVCIIDELVRIRKALDRLASAAEKQENS